MKYLFDIYFDLSDTEPVRSINSDLGGLGVGKLTADVPLLQMAVRGGRALTRSEMAYLKAVTLAQVAKASKDLEYKPVRIELVKETKI